MYVDETITFGQAMLDDTYGKRDLISAPLVHPPSPLVVWGPVFVVSVRESINLTK